VEILHHPGGVFGANAQMLKVPAAALDVIIIVNRSDVSAMDLTFNILDVCLPDLDPVREPYQGPIAKGVYRSTASGRVVQLVAAEQDDGPQSAQIITIDGHRLPFAPDEDGVLRVVTPALFLKYAVTLMGDPTDLSAIELDDFGYRDHLLPATAAANNYAEVILGRYRNDTSATEAVILTEGGKLKMRTVGRFGTAVHTLSQAADGIWNSSPEDNMALPPWSVLSFDQDHRSFLFSNVLTRNLLFRRLD
jgi:hypothetical protein